jgi:hypothetical protein
LPDPLEHEVNPDYMDVFKFAIPGTGYPLPGGYDELHTYLCITMRAPAWECSLGSSCFPKHGKLELAASGTQPGGWEPWQNTTKLLTNRYRNHKVLLNSYFE